VKLVANDFQSLLPEGAEIGFSQDKSTSIRQLLSDLAELGSDRGDPGVHRDPLCPVGARVAADRLCDSLRRF
jgi:hypothetical protein